MDQSKIPQPTGHRAYVGTVGSRVRHSLMWRLVLSFSILSVLTMAVVAAAAFGTVNVPLRAQLPTVLAFGLLSTWLFALGALVIARRISRPVSALALAARRIADGDFSVTAPVLSGDEIGMLANSFNDLTVRLKDLQRDLTDQVEMNEQVTRELAEARDLADSANQTKSGFLAMTSHEVRTQLNGVIGMARLLLDTGLDRRQRDQAETVLASGQALLRIINDVLDFSKIEAAQLEIEAIPFELKVAVFDVEVLLGDRARAKGLSMSMRYPSDLPRHLIGDPERIRQVLLNLVGNAIKFTEKGRIEVAVDFRHDTDDHLVLRLSVQDSGMGIPVDLQPRLFKPFSQAEASTTRRFGGTGLGLAISRRLVELMGGQIGVDSRPGEGSRFWFTLRLKPATGSAGQPQTRPVLEQAPAIGDVPTHGDALEVLVAEDDLVSQKVISGLLEKLGCRVTVVADGQEALQSVRRADYDLLFMDCQMPRLDGYEATRAIRRWEAVRGGRIPIVAVTAHAMPPDRQRCLEAGMDDYVSKPVNPSELHRALKRWSPRSDATVGDASAGVRQRRLTSVKG